MAINGDKNFLKKERDAPPQKHLHVLGGAQGGAGTIEPGKA